MKVFKIDGYWKEDKSEFSDMLVSEYDDVPVGYNYDDIFFFGLSEEDLKNSCLEDSLEFVVTKFEEVDKIYSIPIAWSSYKRIDVNASNLQEACEKALKQFLSEPDDNYLQDSFEIDGIIKDENPNEELDLTEIHKNI